MHVNLRKAVGIFVLPLLGGALAVGAAAPPARAQTWKDTSLVASNVTNPPTATGAVINGVVVSTAGGSSLTYSPPSGEAFSGWLLNGQTGTFAAALTGPTAQKLTIATTGSGSGQATFKFTINSTTTGVTCTAAETVTVTQSGTLLAQSTPSSTPSEKFTVLVSNNSATGAVLFSPSFTVVGQVCTLTFSQSNLPAGLTSGNPLVPGSAAPGSYGGVGYTATDPLGSTFSGTFSLRVYGNQVTPPTGNYGNNVNRYGNGFDAYQQRQYPGAIIAGWTATKGDPATHFLRLNGTVPGAYKFEYAPKGAGTGLCVSDPGGGWASNPLPDGLILTVCNTGRWQQFVPQRNGTLRNVATGLYVSPNGTGAQLRGTTAPTSWGGSVYRWTPYRQLPR